MLNTIWRCVSPAQILLPTFQTFLCEGYAQPLSVPYLCCVRSVRRLLERIPFAMVSVGFRPRWLPGGAKLQLAEDPATSLFALVSESSVEARCLLATACMPMALRAASTAGNPRGERTQQGTQRAWPSTLAGCLSTQVDNAHHLLLSGAWKRSAGIADLHHLRQLSLRVRKPIDLYSMPVGLRLAVGAADGQQATGDQIRGSRRFKHAFQLDNDLISGACKLDSYRR